MRFRLVLTAWANLSASPSPSCPRYQSIASRNSSSASGWSLYVVAILFPNLAKHVLAGNRLDRSVLDLFHSPRRDICPGILYSRLAVRGHLIVKRHHPISELMALLWRQ